MSNRKGPSRSASSQSIEQQITSRGIDWPFQFHASFYRVRGYEYSFSRETTLAPYRWQPRESSVSSRVVRDPEERAYRVEDLRRFSGSFVRPRVLPGSRRGSVHCVAAWTAGASSRGHVVAVACLRGRRPVCYHRKTACTCSFFPGHALRTAPTTIPLDIPPKVPRFPAARNRGTIAEEAGLPSTHRDRFELGITCDLAAADSH